MEEKLQTENNVLVHEEHPQAGHTIENKSKSKTPILIAIFLSLILVAGVGAYYFGTKNANNSTVLPKTLEKITQTVKKEESGSLFSGKLEKLNEDLQLTTKKPNFIFGKTYYYKAGVYLKGKYKDYTRYVVVFKPLGPSDIQTHVVASKDKLKFILDGNPVYFKSESESENDFTPLNFLDRTKISSIEKLDTEHSETISLNDKFALFRRWVVTSSTLTNQKDSDGNQIPEPFLVIDFTGKKNLTSPVSNLTFYDTPIVRSVQVKPNPEDSFISRITGINVVDSTGLAYSYGLSTPEKISAYLAAQNSDIAKLEAYYKADDQYKQTTKNFKGALPPSPQFPTLSAIPPNLDIKKTDIQATTGLYSSYSLAFPGICSMDINMDVVNLADSDLTKIGTSKDGDVYVLKDLNHALNKAQFRVKTWQEQTGADREKTFLEWNNKPKPSYDEYVTKNPLLFFKDYWGRWVVLGESDYKIISGCS